MHSIRTILLALCALGLAAACADVEPDAPVASSSQASHVDWCELYNWYGDGVCDEFCANPDPDCEPELPLPPAGDCGGLAGLSCDEGEYCAYSAEAACGAADQMGTCTPIPDVMCTQQYDPVCGCDGQTYGNACMAAASGASIAFEGECLPLPPAGDCGGLAGLSCDEGEYCAYSAEAACGAADQMGTCTPIPDVMCTQQYDPVCGCDGQTYGNACMAAASGASIAFEGECLPLPPAGDCGGLAGLSCDEGEYCAYSAEAACGAADQMGTCTPQPTLCTQQYDPVCGCDDQTYGNACSAAAAGVSVASVGPCVPPAPSCAGNCGGAAPDNACYCDDACSRYGDCCDDYAAVCR